MARILSTYELKQLVFIDESSVDRRLLNKCGPPTHSSPPTHPHRTACSRSLRRYGYALRGARARSERGIAVRGKRWSVLGFFDLSMGHVGHVAKEGGFDAREFADACEDALARESHRAHNIRSAAD